MGSRAEFMSPVAFKPYTEEVLPSMKFCNCMEFRDSSKFTVA